MQFALEDKNREICDSHAFDFLNGESSYDLKHITASINDTKIETESRRPVLHCRSQSDIFHGCVYDGQIFLK